MLKREGDKIIFESDSQRERVASSLVIADDEFHLQMLRLMAKARQNAHKIWKWLNEELEGQLQSDEMLVYRHDIEEMRVVKTTNLSYPERATKDEE